MYGHFVKSLFMEMFNYSLPLETILDPLASFMIKQSKFANILFLYEIDLGDGQFSERCDADGSFFNSDAIPIIFWKSLTSPSSQLFSSIIGNDCFSTILLILGPIILGLLFKGFSRGFKRFQFANIA